MLHGCAHRTSSTPASYTRRCAAHKRVGQGATDSAHAPLSNPPHAWLSARGTPARTADSNTWCQAALGHADSGPDGCRQLFVQQECATATLKLTHAKPPQRPWGPHNTLFPQRRNLRSGKPIKPEQSFDSRIACQCFLGVAACLATFRLPQPLVGPGCAALGCVCSWAGGSLVLLFAPRTRRDCRLAHAKRICATPSGRLLFVPAPCCAHTPTAGPAPREGSTRDSLPAPVACVGRHVSQRTRRSGGGGDGEDGKAAAGAPQQGQQVPPRPQG